MKTKTTLLFGGLALGAYLLLHKYNNKGIGAVKRRIYKEISLAQDAGIDFAKTFADMTEDEINKLEELGHAAGWEQKEQKPYAEAYYTSLRKAYNAISGLSGIGRAYDIKDKDGNVCLTWIEDAQAHVAHEREIQEKRQRTLELEEKIRKTRNRTKKLREPNVISKGMNILSDGITMGERTPNKQLELFGIGYSDNKIYTLQQLQTYLDTHKQILEVTVYPEVRNGKELYWCTFIDDEARFGGRSFYLGKNNLKELYRYCRWHCIPFAFWDENKGMWCTWNWREGVSGMGALSVEDGLEPELLAFVRNNVDERRMTIAFEQIDKMRCPLSMAEPTLYDNIIDLVDEWCMDNAIDPDSVWGLYDAEDIFWAL